MRRNPGKRGAAVSIVMVVGMLFATLIVGAAPASAAPSWSVMPPVAGAQYGRLAAVSCATPTSCFAVGVSDWPTAQTRLVERWNGSHWSAVASANPAGATASQFTSVHCITSTNCFAVGQYTNAALITKTMVQRWNGSTWSITPSPNPAGIPVSGLASVHCASATFCIAVGSAFDGTTDSSAEKTLVEQWNGASWKIVASPNQPNATDSGVAGVWCPSTTNCVAVGHYSTALATKTLAERWNGTKWSIVASPSPAGIAQSELSAVTCPSPSSCFAVGSGSATLVEHWNGSVWKTMTSPNPVGATGASLVAISCPTTTRCYAVSDFFKGSVQRLVETWNGTSWSIVNTPAPPGTIRSSFNGVSCATTPTNATNCFAVGEYRMGPSRRPLIERFS